MKFVNALLILFSGSLAWGHAHITSPTPRDTNPGIKTGPCGPMAKSTNPVVVTAGSVMTINWQETINHPGKYIFTWLNETDAPMVGQTAVMIPDNANGTADLPHNYQTQLTVPNTPCNNCALQLVQSMEENPAAPTFYYSCVDVRITALAGTTPTPTVPSVTPPVTSGPGTNVLNQSSTGYSGEKVVVGGGCGSVTMKNGGGGGFGGSAGLLLMTLPFLTFLILRRRLSLTAIKIR